MSSPTAVFSITPDVLVRNEGTVFLFCPLTPQGQEWIDEHVASDALWFGHALVVERRYAWPLAVGKTDAGLVLAGSLTSGEKRSKVNEWRCTRESAL